MTTNEDREQGTTEYTVRTCSACGGLYTWPKGSRRPGGKCERCEPALEGFEEALR